MRTEFIRIYKSLHTWVGIVSGMALFIAFYAGALTVFKEPLTRWASPPSAQAAVPLQQAPELIQKTLQAAPTVANDFEIHLADNEVTPARMSWHMRDGQNQDDHDESGNRYFIATLDEQGQAHLTPTRPTSLANFIDILHRVVGLPVDNDPNRWIMGVVATLYALALVSGVVVLLPSLVKDFFALRVGKNLKRMWLDAHNVVGIISLPFHIVMAITAVVFAFHDGIYLAQDKILHENKLAAMSAQQRNEAKPATIPAHNPANMLAPTELVARIHAVAPTFEPTSLQYLKVNGAQPQVRVWGKDTTAVAPRARGGFAVIDPYNGRILKTDFMPGKQSTPELFISSFFALHMASFGGELVHWLYFMLGLLGAWLFYSGNLLWVESRRRKLSRHQTTLPVQRLDTHLMAAATIGVCLGCICGISLTIVGAKWLHGYVVDLAMWHKILYYGAFFACIGWSFARGAARASVHLLWLAAALTFTIPMTSLLSRSMPALHLWANTSSSALGVDATALAMAFGFAWMARVTSRRVHHGTKDSVWSAGEKQPSKRSVCTTTSVE